MRLRNIRGSREIIAESRCVIREPENYNGKWNTVFGNDHPIYVEAGMGKGRFIMEMAARYPQVNFLGIEMYDSVLLRAVQKIEELEEQPGNLYVIRADARGLPEIFQKGEVERIYLNFSDPWPKDRHAKRRLTSRQFLERYRMVLSENGQVEFKTDNRDLFLFSLEEAESAGWTILARTFDLHNDKELIKGNVMTEYEEKFSSMGNPIHKMVIKP